MKFINKLIIILMMILLILIFYISINKYKLHSLQNTYAKENIEQLKTDNKVNTWKVNTEIIKNELQKQNQLIILQGRQEMLELI